MNTAVFRRNVGPPPPNISRADGRKEHGNVAPSVLRSIVGSHIFCPRTHSSPENTCETDVEKVVFQCHQQAKYLSLETLQDSVSWSTLCRPATGTTWDILPPEAERKRTHLDTLPSPKGSHEIRSSMQGSFPKNVHKNEKNEGSLYRGPWFRKCLLSCTQSGTDPASISHTLAPNKMSVLAQMFLNGKARLIWNWPIHSLLCGVGLITCGQPLCRVY